MPTIKFEDLEVLHRRVVPSNVTVPPPSCTIKDTEHVRMVERELGDPLIGRRFYRMTGFESRMMGYVETEHHVFGSMVTKDRKYLWLRESDLEA